MPSIALRDLIIDPTVQIRRGNHEQTVRRYEDSFENLPPVDVFKTPEGLLLADGFHRVAAAFRLGRPDIDANVHRGTREDALEFAVTANTKNADPLTEDERDDGIRRLHQLHGQWPHRQIAETMSVSVSAVRRVMQADKVARVLPQFVSPRAKARLVEVASASEAHWKPLLEAAEERGWTRDETRRAVQNLKSERIPAGHKRDLLAGRTDPLDLDASGELAVPASAVGRKLKELRDRDALLTLYRALEATGRLRHFDMAKLADAVAEDGRLVQVSEEVENLIEISKELLSALRRVKGRKLEVV